jgi:hypothetical protein
MRKKKRLSHQSEPAVQRVGLSGPAKRFRKLMQDLKHVSAGKKLSREEMNARL